MDIFGLLKNYLDGENKLIAYPSKRKFKTVALFFMATKFESNKFYTEKELNQIITESCCFNDTALLRRELFTYKFINREKDGSRYWLEEIQPTPEEFGLTT